MENKDDILKNSVVKIRTPEKKPLKSSKQQETYRLFQLYWTYFPWDKTIRLQQKL